MLNVYSPQFLSCFYFILNWLMHLIGRVTPSRWVRALNGHTESMSEPFNLARVPHTLPLLEWLSVCFFLHIFYWLTKPTHYPQLDGALYPVDVVFFALFYVAHLPVWLGTRDPSNLDSTDASFTRSNTSQGRWLLHQSQWVPVSCKIKDVNARRTTILSPLVLHVECWKILHEFSASDPENFEQITFRLNFQETFLLF